MECTQKKQAFIYNIKIWEQITHRLNWLNKAEKESLNSAAVIFRLHVCQLGLSNSLLRREINIPACAGRNWPCPHRSHLNGLGEKRPNSPQKESSEAGQS